MKTIIMSLDRNRGKFTSSLVSVLIKLTKMYRFISTQLTNTQSTDVSITRCFLRPGTLIKTWQCDRFNNLHKATSIKFEKFHNIFFIFKNSCRQYYISPFIYIYPVTIIIWEYVTNKFFYF